MRQEVHDKLNELRDFDEDWTDYEGHPVAAAQREAMRGLLDALMTDDTPTPVIYGIDGLRVVADWDTGASILSVSTTKGGGFECYAGSMVDDSEFDEWATDGPDDRLRELVARLPGRKP